MDSSQFNPLVDNLSDLSTSELSDAISELSKKYFMTRNPEVQMQIQSVLEMYRAEAVSRQAKETLDQNKSQNGENSLDNLINIS
tara:strand:+ start:35 stop:286 length:252 start_codon:yes stop_codon:yes gene_type:complete